MKRKFIIPLVVLVFVFVFTAQSSACRFWVASGKTIPEEMVKQQLIELPHSLKNLGNEYNDGWSVAFYKGAASLIARSAKSSSEDEKFNQAVVNASMAHPNIFISHLRRASSGCTEGVPNPHPFQRYHKGKNWLFGHNGGIDKKLLISLIGEEYLDANPPQTCVDNPPVSWVDSELYFIYFLKKIEEADENVLKGLQNAIDELSRHIDDESQYLNFFLVDSNKVWAYRKGTSLYYTYDRQNRLSIISSTVPGQDQFEWKEFPEEHFALLRPHKRPKFYDTKR